MNRISNYIWMKYYCSNVGCSKVTNLKTTNLTQILKMAFILKTSKSIVNHTNCLLLNRLLSTKELTVSPYCNINIKSNFNLYIEPLDVFKYHNCDKVIIQNESENDTICSQDNDTIDIISNVNSIQNTSCKIIAPVKASKLK